MFFFLLTVCLSFYKMFRIIRTGINKKEGEYTLVLTSQPIAPFSWGYYIILSEEDYINNPEEILTHEKMHLHYRHSFDIIFIEIISIMQWFNPAAWLLKRELRDIHEYQADKGVLNQGIDATKYQLLLVKKRENQIRCKIRGNQKIISDFRPHTKIVYSRKFVKSGSFIHVH